MKKEKEKNISENKKNILTKIKEKSVGVKKSFDSKDREFKMSEEVSFWLLILMLFIAVGFQFSPEKINPIITIILYSPGLIISALFLREMRGYFIASLITFFRGLILLILTSGFLESFLNVWNFLGPILATVSIILVIRNYIILRKKAIK